MKIHTADFLNKCQIDLTGLFELVYNYFTFYLNFLAKTSTLKDGNYNVAGHVIEIRNGIRVQSASKTQPTNTENDNVFVNNGKFQDSVYQPNSYLHHHLHTLSNESSKLYNTTNNETIPPKVDVYDHLLIESKSPTDSLCSNDSLSSPNRETSEQKLLRSSLKGSSMKFSTSKRKVTFSDSVEFNDGDTKPVFKQPAARVPLYQRLENSSNKLLNNQKAATPSPSFTNSEPITTEHVLDQLRQEALLPKYPSNEDFSYPDSIVLSQPSNIAIVSPLGVSQSQNHGPNVLSIHQKSSETEILNDSLTEDSIEISTPEPKTRAEPRTDYSANSLPQSTTVVYSAPKKVELPKSDNSSVTYIPSDISYDVDQKPEPNKTQILSNNDNIEHQFIAQTPSLQNGNNSLNNFSSKDKLKPCETTPSGSSSVVIKIHSDTVKSYLSDLVKSNSSKVEDSLENQLVPSSSEDKIGKIETDELYRSIEASLAGVTFDNVNKDNESSEHRPKNNPHGELDFDSKLESQLAPTDSECISSAVKDGTSIPVRVHSGNVRRGRIIVSANEKKRRTISNFSPHPPPPQKQQQQQQQQSLKRESPRVSIAENSKHSRTRSMDNRKKDIPPKSYPTPKASVPQTSKPPNKRNSFTSPGYQVDKVYSPKNKTVIDKYSPRTKTQNNNRPYSSNSNSPKSKVNNSNHSSNINNNNNNNNNDIRYYNDTQSYHQTPIKDYRQASTNQQQRQQKQQHSSNKPDDDISLSKTPTDEEINKLWANVRGCLPNEAPEQAYSDTAFIAPRRSHHQRTFSGSLVRRVSNDRSHPSNSNGSRMNINNSNNRYGSHEMLYRPNSSDSSFSGSSFTKRHALLPQRTNRVLSPKIVTDFTLNGYNDINNKNNNNNTYFARKKHETTGSSAKKKSSEGIFFLYE